MRHFVVLEVMQSKGAVDPSGNVRWLPKDRREREELWLHPSCVIECADSGPGYIFINQGDKFVNEKGLIETATREMNECDLFCFPAPEREEEEVKSKKRRGVKTSDGNVYQCKDCPEVIKKQVFAGSLFCGAEDRGLEDTQNIPKWCPLAVTIEEPVDPAEYMGGAMVGVL
ncbi:MAG: hypothetical protein KJ604_20030 [Gammaproteobacteria bacterium]|uniref:Uncharacterized protein n=1 Tax=viral metagenome TaxID=1070528 RepID=A0A6M3LKR2_9ZZZZ|nr:hypothetical protein [Gammaproteobacteria bacterium]